MRFFDFEVTPNWWMCVFGDLPEECKDEKGNYVVTEEIKNTFIAIDSDMPDARNLILDKLREDGYVQVGYNVKGYDLIIANGIYQGFTPQQIKIINDIIINPGCAYSTKEHCRMASFAKRKLSGIIYQDLLDDGTGSLKEKEATLGLSILESSVDFNKEHLTEEDKQDMTFYCKQDVYASMVFYSKVVHPYTLTKLAMGKHFNIPVATCYTSTNARLVALALGAKRQSFDDEELIEIDLPEKIRDYCYENLPINILERIRTSTNGFEVFLFENMVSFGNGGIHSVYTGTPCKKVDAPCIYAESNDDYVLLNVDAGSYYPSILIQLGCLSRTVKNPQVFIDIFNERMEIKHLANKTDEQEMAQLADKLVLNTTFGASGNKWLDLYDPYMCTRCCRIGQIFLAALACKIYKNVPGIKIIQTNTDGILVYCPRNKLDYLRKLEKEWSDISGILMEEDDVVRIWQRDVNNYLLEKRNKKGELEIKRKGLWLNTEWLRKGYVTTATVNGYVCAKAAQRYLLYGEDIIQNIVKNNNLLDFTIVCTKGPTFRGVVQRDAFGNETPLFKSNRVIASKNKSLGMIYKYKMYKGNLQYNKMPGIPEHCRLINDDISTYDFDEIKKDIDYMYYIERTVDLLSMQWYQMTASGLKKTDRFNIDKYL